MGDAFAPPGSHLDRRTGARFSRGTYNPGMKFCRQQSARFSFGLGGDGDL